MWFNRDIPWYSEGNRNRYLILAAVIVATIAFIDYRIPGSIGLGFLYIIPILLAGGFLPPWEILLLAMVCSILREMFGGFLPGPERVPRLVFTFLAYAVTGFYVRQTVLYRRAALQHLAELEHEVSLRRQAEEQLETLIHSSPAGIITVSREGKIAMSNEAARQIFGVAPGGLTGQPVASFLPLLERVQESQPRLVYRTAFECRGQRANGETFLAHVWLSTFSAGEGPGMAAIVLDSSEELRDREETGLRQLLAGSRIMVGAVSHEIRNFVGAIAVVHANLGRIPSLVGNADFRALGNLVEGLRAVASSSLLMSTEPAEGVDLWSVLEDFRIIADPAARDAQCEVQYTVPASLPRVRGHRQRLLQVLLNLANNSFRALRDSPEKKLKIIASSVDGAVTVEFQDTGPGIQQPDLLFRPFQRAADATGLGLYVSRAIVRSFAGELRFQPTPTGCRFVVELVPAPAGAMAEVE
ncbi:MAG: ATP-binding protein [Terriglobales bacterium]